MVRGTWFSGHSIHHKPLMSAVLLVLQGLVDKMLVLLLASVYGNGISLS